MLEACISVRANGGDPFNKRGDVVVLKLQPASWGIEEMATCLVVEWKDEEKEAHLKIMKTKGNNIPILIYPYIDERNREVIKKTKGVYERKIRSVEPIRSTRYFDIDSLPKPLFDRVMDPKQIVEVQKWDDIKTYVKER